MALVRGWIEIAALGIEVFAVLVMVAFIVRASWHWIRLPVHERREGYRAYRQGIARALLVGLELLVAADIIRTVVVEPTLPNMAILAGLVLIRTFLGWSLTLEIEGRWPWQKAADRGPGASQG